MWPVSTRLLAALVLCLTAALAPAGPVAANPYDDYRRSGTINPCNYSNSELQNTLNNLPPDVQQYSPGLADQLSAGREGCGGGAPGAVTGDTRQFEAVPAPTASGGGPGAAAGAQTRVPDPPAPEPAARQRLSDLTAPAVKASTGADVPPWVTALLAALALAALLLALVRYGGMSTERFTRPLAASFSEAGGRTADAMAELWDSVRMGR